MSDRKTDVIVIGGGIIGLLTARELLLAGQSVRVVERGRCGQESTWAGGGILSPLYPWRYKDAITALASWGQPRYPEALQAIHEESGIDPEYLPSGLLILDQDERPQALAWRERHGLALESLTGEALLALEPQIAASDAALWMPEVGQVRNPRLARSLRASVSHLGGVIEEGCEVESLELTQQRVTGVVTTQGRRQAGAVIVASGAWSRQLLLPYGVALEVEPVRGQMIVYAAPVGLVRHIVLSAGHYVIPRADGHVVVGSTLEYAGFDKQTTAAARTTLIEAAEAIIPALAEQPIERQWAGLRPGTPDGVPYICQHPELSGLFINSGHFRNGVVLGLASARLMADLVLARGPILQPEPYRLQQRM